MKSFITSGPVSYLHIYEWRCEKNGLQAMCVKPIQVSAYESLQTDQTFAFHYLAPISYNLEKVNVKRKN